MQNIKAIIKEREKMLCQVIKKKEAALKKAPEGSLRANKHGKGIQYYHYISSENRNGTYLKQSQERLIRLLAQKEYDQKVLRKAYTEYAFIRKWNEFYEQGMMEDVYDKIAALKQHLVTPVWLPDKMYAEQWENADFEGLRFREDMPEYYSDKGERVRSKSELLIANALNRRGIPYKYECPLELDFYGIVYPDFTILNIKERKEIYWEHLGLMDDHDYREKNFNKIVYYESNGYFPGDRLILTFETARQPLTTKMIEMMINKYLL